MDINLNDKNIIKIVYKLNDGSKVNFHYKDGELMTIDNVNDEYKPMVKKSSKLCSFLNKTWSNIKKSCKTKNKKKENPVGLQNAQELIKMEVDGRMDEIARQKRNLFELFERDNEANNVLLSNNLKRNEETLDSLDEN